MRYDFTAADDLHPGADKILEVEILDRDPDLPNGTPDPDAVPIDVSAFTLAFVVGIDGQPPLLAKSTADATQIWVVGVYTAVRATNTQRVRIRILANDTRGIPLRAGQALRYEHALTREDLGSEDVLMYGEFPFRRSVAA